MLFIEKYNTLNKYIRLSWNKHNMFNMLRLSLKYKKINKPRRRRKIKIFEYNLNLISFFKNYFGSLNFNHLFYIAKKAYNLTFLKKIVFFEKEVKKILNTKIDSVIFKINLVPTIFYIKQLITHNHILLNNKNIKHNNILLNSGDIINFNSDYFFNFINFKNYFNLFFSQNSEFLIKFFQI